MHRPGPAAWLLAALILSACGGSTTAPDNGDEGMSGMPGGASDSLTDDQVFNLAKSNTGWVYYRLSEDTLAAAPSSPHTGRIRTRYNVTAQAGLDSLGRVRQGAVFPDGSMIVKEVYSKSGGVLTDYAVMYKLPKNPNAGPLGWLWADFRPTGIVLQSISNDPKVCHTCHSIGIDDTRMNDTHD